eukprot:COSAG02_NODE_844_length_16583_cov_116.650267_13_plen_52_part_00
MAMGPPAIPMGVCQVTHCTVPVPVYSAVCTVAVFSSRYTVEPEPEHSHVVA